MVKIDVTVEKSWTSFNFLFVRAKLFYDVIFSSGKNCWEKYGALFARKWTSAFTISQASSTLACFLLDVFKATVLWNIVINISLIFHA